MVQCSGCDFIYLRNLPGYDALEDEFAWEKTSDLENLRRLQLRPLSARLSRITRWRLGLFGRSFNNVDKYFQAGNILDIGCGAGSLKFGTHAIPYGIEVSRSLHAIADKNMREKGGYAVQAPALVGIKNFEDNFFDGVVMFSYLEHEQNPAMILSEVMRVLKPGSRVYLRVPNYGSINRRIMGKKWCGFRYPDHTNYFTRKTLKRMVNNAGFDFLVLNSLTLAFDDNINALLAKPE
ncbi:MAG: class I SAM-dependent methyltransferase [Rhizobiaceae bacterium]|nr:class I SAM-dependent methyltransferase [Rhizobiaceae bacterium]